MKKKKLKEKVSIKSVLASGTHDLVVPKSKEFTLEMGSKESDRFINNVVIRKLSDLKDLDIIPTDLDEKELLSAINLDNQEALEVVKRSLKPGNCNCSQLEKETQNSPSSIKQMNSTYGSLRSNYNFAFTELLSKHLNLGLNPNDMLVKQTKKWIDSLQIGRKIIIKIVTINNIVIEQNATLFYSSNIDLVNANKLQIHKGGKIIVRGSYLHFKCKSAEGSIN